MIKIQSIADVITNSSSEIFVIKDPKDTEMSLDSYRGFLGDLRSYIIAFLKLEHKEQNYTYYNEPEDCYEVSIADHKHYDLFYEYGYDVGDLLIESTEDNSIPWEVMDYIQESAQNHGYSCKRRHLG